LYITTLSYIFRWLYIYDFLRKTILNCWIQISRIRLRSTRTWSRRVFAASRRYDRFSNLKSGQLWQLISRFAGQSDAFFAQILSFRAKTCRLSIISSIFMPVTLISVITEKRMGRVAPSGTKRAHQRRQHRGSRESVANKHGVCQVTTLHAV